MDNKRVRFSHDISSSSSHTERDMNVSSSSANPFVPMSTNTSTAPHGWTQAETSWHLKHFFSTTPTHSRMEFIQLIALELIKSSPSPLEAQNTAMRLINTISGHATYKSKLGFVSSQQPPPSTKTADKKPVVPKRPLQPRSTTLDPTHNAVVPPKAVHQSPSRAMPPPPPRNIVFSSRQSSGATPATAPTANRPAAAPVSMYSPTRSPASNVHRSSPAVLMPNQMCSKCPTQLKDIRRRAQHLLRHGSNVGVKCDYCDYFAKSRSMKTRHERCHERETVSTSSVPTSRGTARHGSASNLQNGHLEERDHKDSLSKRIRLFSASPSPSNEGNGLDANGFDHYEKSQDSDEEYLPGDPIRPVVAARPRFVINRSGTATMPSAPLETVSSRSGSGQRVIPCTEVSCPYKAKTFHGLKIHMFYHRNPLGKKPRTARPTAERRAGLVASLPLRRSDRSGLGRSPDRFSPTHINRPSVIQALPGKEKDSDESINRGRKRFRLDEVLGNGEEPSVAADNGEELESEQLEFPEIEADADAKPVSPAMVFED